MEMEVIGISLAFAADEAMMLIRAPVKSTLMASSASVQLSQEVRAPIYRHQQEALC